MTIFQERNPIIIIPAYCPDKRLIKLIKEIRNLVEFPIIVIDDGSGDKYTDIFLETKKFSNCLLYHNNINKGKGAALKNGVLYAIDKFPNNCGYITCDADGQHIPEDIIHIANVLKENPSSLILGVRDFSSNNVPARSKIGNKLSSLLLYSISGLRCNDTQTGLRGISRKYETIFLSEPGDRYDFEMNFLTSMAKSNVDINQIPIKTIYIDDNKSSHFRAIKDSITIFGGLLKYGFSSILSSAVDLSLFTFFNLTLFKFSSFSILLSTIIARLLSGVFNFSLNKKWVFKNQIEVNPKVQSHNNYIDFDAKENTVQTSNTKHYTNNEIIKYSILFFSQMCASGLLVSLLNNLISNATISKLIVDILLFFVSYFIQKNIVFTKKNPENIQRKAL